MSSGHTCRLAHVVKFEEYLRWERLFIEFERFLLLVVPDTVDIYSHLTFDRLKDRLNVWCVLTYIVDHAANLQTPAISRGREWLLLDAIFPKFNLMPFTVKICPWYLTDDTRNLHFSLFRRILQAMMRSRTWFWRLLYCSSVAAWTNMSLTSTMT